MVREWVFTSWTDVGLVVLSAPAVYAAVIVLTRVNGLRSFAKMSAFDFATTVAVGTLLSSAIATRTPPLLQALAALVMLFAMQYLVARLRLRSSAFRGAVDNAPLLLMRNGEMLRDNMHSARITEVDLRSHLRAANVLGLSDVRAVVLETTGDVNVLRGAGPLDERLLEGVRQRVEGEGPRSAPPGDGGTRHTSEARPRRTVARRSAAARVGAAVR